jgi:cysteine desulfurase/selenocysteine lyase
VAEIARRAHAVGALVLADAAQAVPHAGVRLDTLGVDFLGFTGHKALGPMGVGVLAAREELLEGMEPFLGGGEMIRDVEIDRATWNDIPWRFEAGTPNVAEAVGLGAAVDYLQALGMDRVRAHEADVTGYALKRLGEIEGLRVYGPSEVEHRGGMVSFTLGDIHPHDVAQVLDSDGIAVRAGHHCAKPLLRRLGVQATTRASFYLYSTTEEVDALVAGLEKVKRFFA